MNTLRESCSQSPEVQFPPRSQSWVTEQIPTPSRGLRCDLGFIYTASITNMFASSAFKETRSQTPGAGPGRLWGDLPGQEGKGGHKEAHYTHQ